MLGLDDLKEKTGEALKVVLGKTMNAAIKEPTIANQAAYQKALKAVEEHDARQAQAKAGADPKAPAAEQLFKNPRQVAVLLAGQGWKISENTAYNHRERGLLRPDREGLFSESAVLRYANDHLKRKDGAGWKIFLRRLGDFSGVKLAISDDHLGLKSAVASELPRAARQRCRTHFMRNPLIKPPKSDQDLGPPWCAQSLLGPMPRRSGASMAEWWSSWRNASVRRPRCWPRRRGQLGLHHLPQIHLAVGVVQLPPGAVQPRDQARHRHAGHLT